MIWASWLDGQKNIFESTIGFKNTYFLRFSLTPVWSWSLQVFRGIFDVTFLLILVTLHSSCIMHNSSSCNHFNLKHQEYLFLVQMSAKNVGLQNPLPSLPEKIWKRLTPPPPLVKNCCFCTPIYKTLRKESSNWKYVQHIKIYIKGKVSDLFTSYLTNRQQVVVIDGQTFCDLQTLFIPVWISW